MLKNYIHPCKTIRATGYLPKLCSNSSSYHYPPRSKLNRCIGQEVSDYPRRACAAYLSVCVCVSVCYRSSSYSVRFNLQPTASAALYRRLIFEKAFRSKVYGVKKQMSLELAASRFRALSGPTKHSSYVKGNWWVECCFRG